MVIVKYSTITYIDFRPSIKLLNKSKLDIVNRHEVGSKTFGKIETASFGSILEVWLKKFFFRNKTFLFFKIKSWNFQVQLEIKFRETSQNFNSFSLFRQLLFYSFFDYRLSSWVEILRGFTKFNFKLNLKVSAFYLEKTKSFIPK